MSDVYDLAAQRPRLEIGQARALAAELYGRDGTLEQLPSERDQNFRIVTADGGCVLKIAGDADDAAVLDLQNRALDWIASARPELPVPRVVRTVGGDPLHCIDHDGHAYWVRMLTYLPGRPLARHPASRRLRLHPRSEGGP